MQYEDPEKTKDEENAKKVHNILNNIQVATAT